MNNVKILPGKSFVSSPDFESENKTFLAFELSVSANDSSQATAQSHTSVHNSLAFITDKMVKCFKDNKLSTGNIFNHKVRLQRLLSLVTRSLLSFVVADFQNYLHHVSFAWINQSFEDLDKPLLEKLVLVSCCAFFSTILITVRVMVSLVFERISGAKVQTMLRSFG